MNQLELNFAPAHVPSISSSSMLVELSLSFWSARKLDRQASEEVTTAKHANKGVARVNKKLLGDCAELDAIQKFAGNVRLKHYSMTLPWSDMGPRLLPTTKFFDYQKIFTALEAEFNMLVQKFLDAYDLEVAAAQARLGDLFDVREYPSVDELRSKFSFRLNYIPLPDAGDWRLDVGNEAIKSLREQYEAHYVRQIEGAMRDIWERLHDVLSTLSRQLADKTEDGKTPKIYQSVFERALEVVDLMETCNITGDVQMQLMQRKLAQAFRGVTVEAVKDDSHLRRETKKAIDEAIKALPGIGF